MSKKKITDQDRRNRIQPILDQWVPALGLSDWEITWELVNDIPGTSLGNGKPGGRVSTRGPYQNAHIRFTRVLIDTCALDSELETSIIHELGHCVLHPLLASLERSVGDVASVYEDVHWEVERLLDSLSVLFLAVRDGEPLTAKYSPAL